MIQGGGFDKNLDKKTTGMMPPIKNEWKNGLKNLRGTITRKLKPTPIRLPHSFSLTWSTIPPLDIARGGAAYAVFGKVVEGMENVDKIRDTETKTDPKYPGGEGGSSHTCGD